MIARMPELSLSETSATLKPRRPSISSCVSTRSAPLLLPLPKLGPSSTAAAHCWAAASCPSPALVPAAASVLAAPSASRLRPHSAANASWSTWSLPFAIAVTVLNPCVRVCTCVRRLLHDDFLEQHGVDAAGRDRHIDPPGQLLLETIEPGGTFEIARPQLAQIGLE